MELNKEQKLYRYLNTQYSIKGNLTLNTFIKVNNEKLKKEYEKFKKKTKLNLTKNEFKRGIYELLSLQQNKKINNAERVTILEKSKLLKKTRNVLTNVMFLKRREKLKLNVNYYPILRRIYDHNYLSKNMYFSISHGAVTQDIYTVPDDILIVTLSQNGLKMFGNVLDKYFTTFLNNPKKLKEFIVNPLWGRTISSTNDLYRNRLLNPPGSQMFDMDLSYENNQATPMLGIYNIFGTNFSLLQTNGGINAITLARQTYDVKHHLVQPNITKLSTVINAYKTKFQSGIFIFFGCRTGACTKQRMKTLKNLNKNDLSLFKKRRNALQLFNLKTLEQQIIDKPIIYNTRKVPVHISKQKFLQLLYRFKLGDKVSKKVDTWRILEIKYIHNIIYMTILENSELFQYAFRETGEKIPISRLSFPIINTNLKMNNIQNNVPDMFTNDFKVFFNPKTKRLRYYTHIQTKQVHDRFIIQYPVSNIKVVFYETTGGLQKHSSLNMNKMLNSYKSCFTFELSITKNREPTQNEINKLVNNFKKINENLIVLYVNNSPVGFLTMNYNVEANNIFSIYVSNVCKMENNMYKNVAKMLFINVFEYIRHKLYNHQTYIMFLSVLKVNARAKAVYTSLGFETYDSNDKFEFMRRVET